MKRNKTILNGAVVLLIAAFMVMSSLPAMAETRPSDDPFKGPAHDAPAEGTRLTSDENWVPRPNPHPFRTGGLGYQKFDATLGGRAIILSEGFEDPWQPAGTPLAYDDAPFDATWGLWDVEGLATGTSGSGQLAHYWFRDYGIVPAWGTASSGTCSAGIYWSGDSDPPHEAQDEWLMTPVMDLTGWDDIVLNFYSIYNWANLDLEDEFNICVSTDGGTSWTVLVDLLSDPLYELGGSGFAGAGWNWNEVPITLFLPAGTSQYVVAWQVYGGGDGVNPVFFIDDVELSGTEPPPPGGCDFEIISINLDDEVNSEAKNIEIEIYNNGPVPIVEVKKLVSIEVEVPGATSEIWNEGFEGSLSDWMITDNGDMDTFNLSTTRVHSGNYSMRCTKGIDRVDAVQDTYLGHAHDSGPDELILTSPVDFTGAANGQISFWHYCNGEYFINDSGYLFPTDFGLVAIDWGLGWFTLPMSAFVAYDNGWEQVTLDLNALGIPLTSTIAIKFIWDSDPHMEYEGWYIDDISFTRTEPPTYQLVDQMWSIQNMSDFERRIEIFELPWEDMVECNIYKICVQGQVFDPIDCESDFSDNEMCKFVHIYDCEDASVNWIMGPDRIEKCTNGTFTAEIEATGTYPLTDEEVTLTLSRLVESELFFDDFEGGTGNWDLWSWGTPGVVPHATDFDAYSGTTSLAFFDTSGAGYPNVVDGMDARALCNYVFDFSSPDNRGAYLSFYANWANLPGDEWRVMIYDPISNYVLGWYGYSGVNGDFYGPSNPDGFPEMYTFDLKEQIDYWYTALGSVYGMFTNPDGSINYECGIGFYLEADFDGCVYQPGELWSGIMIDDVRVYERFCDDSTAVEVDTETIDFLDIGETTVVEFEFHAEQYCNWCVSASVDDDCNNDNNVARMETRITSTLDDMPTDEAGEDPWDHDDLTDVGGTLWHVVSKHENFDDEPPTDQYFWNGDDALGVYLPNTDDSLVSPTFDLSAADIADVSFDTYFDFSNGDSGEVYYSADGGTHWTLLDTYVGYSHWHNVTYAIPGVDCTDSMKLRFRMRADNVDEANGWYIDDIVVTPYTFEGLVIDENFDVNVFPPLDWTIVDNLPGATWENYVGTARVYYDYYSDTDTELISPEIDLGTFANKILTFDYYVDDYMSANTITCDITTDGGTSWVELASYGDTWPYWASEEIDLTALGYSGIIQLRWRAQFDTSYTIFQVDNILLQDALMSVGTVYYEEDFEGSGAGYTSAEVAGNGEIFEHGTNTTVGAYSGTDIWMVNIDGDYGNYCNTTLTSTPISLAGTVNPHLRFGSWMDCEGYGYDGGNVQISNDGGSTFTIITPVGGYDYTSIVGLDYEPGFAGHYATWDLKTFDLSSYIGDTITIRWHYGSDSSVSAYPGWAIDHVQIVEMIVTGSPVTYLDEDFTVPPITFPPTDWIQVQTSYSSYPYAPLYWYHTQTEQYGYPYPGTLGGAGVWWGYEDQDEWLISPGFDFSDGSFGTVNFKTFCFGPYGSYFEENLVKTTSSYTGDHTTTDWNTLVNLYEISPATVFGPGPSDPNEWMDLTYPVPTGDDVRFAFHRLATYPDRLGIWMVDEIVMEKWTPETPVFVEDVEDVTWTFGGPWSGYTTPAGDWWHLTSARAYTGSVSWWCGDDLTGTYPTSGPGLNDVLYAEFNLSGAPSAPFFSADLEFMHWGEFNTGALAYVEFSKDGLTWNNMWELPHTTYSWDWEKLHFNLDEYVGGNVIIRFRFTAPGDGAPTAEGWYIDDIVIHYKEIIYTDETPPITSICLTGNEISLYAYDPNVPPAPTSGVAATYYILDDGTPQTYIGPFTITLDEDHEIEYWSVDNAGNEEMPHKTFNYEAPDDTPPTITLDMPDGLYIFGNKIMDRIFGDGILAIGKLPIAATANDDVGVTLVTFDINGVNTYFSSGPYEYIFSERHFGELSVTATAFDAAGNSASVTKDDITVYCLGIL